MALEIKQGHYYSNGAYGKTWGVRMVVHLLTDPDSGEDTVHFKGMAGAARRQNGEMPLDEFVRWIRYEVRLVENDWKRVIEDLPPPNLSRQAGEERTDTPTKPVPSPLAGEG